MIGFLLLSSPASAYHEPYAPEAGCNACHNNLDNWDQYSPIPLCQDCHDLTDNINEWYGPDNHYSGPHGFYSTTSSKCDSCHTVHQAAADGAVLLPESTSWDTCLTCHDGTGGFGVYGAVMQQTGINPFD
ncbi:MAG: cytochrome c3 family protein, partial [Coriobacteriia bacterium]